MHGLVLDRDLDPDGAEVVRPELQRDLVPAVAPPVQRDDSRHDLVGDGRRQHRSGRRRVRRKWLPPPGRGPGTAPPERRSQRRRRRRCRTDGRGRRNSGGRQRPAGSAVPRRPGEGAGPVASWPSARRSAARPGCGPAERRRVAGTGRLGRAGPESAPVRRRGRLAGAGRRLAPRARERHRSGLAGAAGRRLAGGVPGGAGRTPTARGRAWRRTLRAERRSTGRSGGAAVAPAAGAGTAGDGGNAGKRAGGDAGTAGSRRHRPVRPASPARRRRSTGRRCGRCAGRRVGAWRRPGNWVNAGRTARRGRAGPRRRRGGDRPATSDGPCGGALGPERTRLGRHPVPAVSGRQRPVRATRGDHPATGPAERRSRPTRRGVVVGVRRRARPASGAAGAAIGGGIMRRLR